MSHAPSAPAARGGANEKLLFWACFISLIATAFGFIIRALIIDDWGRDFGLTQTQKGELFGVGLWPFAVSIILFSLVIDKIGYGTAMVFAFFCHALSVAVTILAPRYFDPYWSLYVGTFIVALGNGTVEAVINPVVATLFPREKTKWLNILHAGWPGGLVIGGIITIAMGSDGVITSAVGDAISWEWKVALILLPTVLYGILMVFCRFPVSERVAAGISYRDMLCEFGAGGALIVGGLVVWELTRVGNGLAANFGSEGLGDNALLWTRIGLTAAITILFGVVTQAIGRPLFLFMLLIMIPLATTELGTDSWISSLMEPKMEAAGYAGGWVLVYTSLIMMVLRFFAGPIVHKLSPLGLLAASAAVAAVGLVFLSRVDTLTLIFVAATIYGFGKTFFWPTMLGVVAEQSPRGGALTLNATGGMGMLGVGVVGAVFLGYIQDTAITSHLKEQAPTIAEEVVVEKRWLFGDLEAVEPAEVDELLAQKGEAEAADVRETITAIEEEAKQGALATVAIFPCIMLVCYLILIAYFRSKGGYKAEVLTGHAAHDEEFTGGITGPADK